MEQEEKRMPLTNLKNFRIEGAGGRNRGAQKWHGTQKGPERWETVIDGEKRGMYIPSAHSWGME